MGDNHVIPDFLSRMKEGVYALYGHEDTRSFIYVEDDRTRRGDKQELRLRAQTRLWGYNHARPNRLDELVSILVDAENPVSDDAAPQALSPEESQRVWRRQAEENVLRRLEETGLLAPAGEVDEVLNTVVNNLMVTNGIDLEVRCRVLLTTPLETFSIGQAIVISRGPGRIQQS